MENASMERYFRTLARLLDCPKPLRKSFLDQTRRMAEDFVQGKPDATAQDVSGYLGDPRELARGFLETLDQDELERYHRRKKFLLRGCIAVLLVALIGISIWGIHIKTSPQDVEVTNTIIIYTESTEET